MGDRSNGGITATRLAQYGFKVALSCGHLNDDAPVPGSPETIRQLLTNVAEGGFAELSPAIEGLA